MPDPFDLAAVFSGVAPGGRYAVIGHPVAHSLSPAMHEAGMRVFGIQASYRAVAVPPGSWPEFWRAANDFPLDGFNVTVPHKERLVAHAADVLGVLCGSVNTLKRTPSGWKAFNTDGPGFIADLRDHGVDVSGKKITMMGAGGSARGLLFAFHTEKARPEQVTIFNRSPARARALAAEAGAVPNLRFPVLVAETADDGNRAVEDADVVINATSVGLDPGGVYPCDLGRLRAGQTAYDLIYHRRTEFLDAAERAGARPMNGLGMLVRQAALAFEIWFGVKPVDVMRRAAEAALKNRQKSEGGRS